MDRIDSIRIREFLNIFLGVLLGMTLSVSAEENLPVSEAETRPSISSEDVQEEVAFECEEQM